jgi:hypothetical protein
MLVSGEQQNKVSIEHMYGKALQISKEKKFTRGRSSDNQFKIADHPT